MTHSPFIPAQAGIQQIFARAWVPAFATAARRDWAEKNNAVATGSARAFGNAYKFMRDPQNRDEVARTIVETTGAPLHVARSMLSFYYEPDRGVMPKQAEISMAGMAKVIELLGETGELKAAPAGSGAVH